MKIEKITARIPIVIPLSIFKILKNIFKYSYRCAAESSQKLFYDVKRFRDTFIAVPKYLKNTAT